MTSLRCFLSSLVQTPPEQIHGPLPGRPLSFLCELDGRGTVDKSDGDRYYRKSPISDDEVKVEGFERKKKENEIQ